MKTYSETQGKTFFDWNAFLENPPERRSLRHRRATDLSGQWVTCACGNLCNIIPRSTYGIPFDNELEMLGISFHALIYDGQWDFAKNTLNLIEKRSSELMAELTK
jgi:hypothetical protein